MTAAEKLYSEIGATLSKKGAEPGKMFGTPIFKTGGKAFVGFADNCMVFNLACASTLKKTSNQGS